MVIIIPSLSRRDDERVKSIFRKCISSSVPKVYIEEDVLSKDLPVNKQNSSYISSLLRSSKERIKGSVDIPLLLSFKRKGKKVQVRIAFLNLLNNRIEVISSRYRTSVTNFPKPLLMQALVSFLKPKIHTLD